MIDRLRLSAAAKNQLSSLKRKTGIEHYNSLCRHALCISLANPTIPPEENYNFNAGVEIDWRTFTGANETLYLNILVTRMLQDKKEMSADNLRKTLTSHVHRGLSYLSSRTDDDLLIGLSQDLSAAQP